MASCDRKTGCAAPIFCIAWEMDNEDDESTLISHLRTRIILAARNSPSGDIEISAVDKIVEATIDFLKNILEQMPKDSERSVDDLYNIIRVRLN